MELSVYGVQTAITDDLSTRYTPYTHTNTQTHTHTNDVDKAGRKKKWRVSSEEWGKVWTQQRNLRGFIDLTGAADEFCLFSPEGKVWYISSWQYTIDQYQNKT